MTGDQTRWVVFDEPAGRTWRERVTLPPEHGPITNTTNGVSWVPTGRLATRDDGETGEVYRPSPPEPDSCDQAYVDQWQSLREWLTPDSRAFHRPTQVIVTGTTTEPTAADGTPGKTTVHTVQLHRHNYTAPAPWTSRPYAYAWCGTSDPQGRIVTGPAYRIHLEDTDD